MGNHFQRHQSANRDHGCSQTLLPHPGAINLRALLFKCRFHLLAPVFSFNLDSPLRLFLTTGLWVARLSVSAAASGMNASEVFARNSLSGQSKNPVKGD